MSNNATMIKWANEMAPMAKVAGERFGIDPMFLLAQSWAEKGGYSRLYTGTQTRPASWNVAGLVAGSVSRDGKVNLLRASEFWNGKDFVRVKHPIKGNPDLIFRRYANPQMGWLDFARLLNSKYKMQNHDTIQAYARAIAQSPYISESNGDNRAIYERNIISAYNRLKIILPTIDAAKTGGPVILLVGVGALLYLMTQ